MGTYRIRCTFLDKQKGIYVDTHIPIGTYGCNQFYPTDKNDRPVQTVNSPYGREPIDFYRIMQKEKIGDPSIERDAVTYKYLGKMKMVGYD